MYINFVTILIILYKLPDLNCDIYVQSNNSLHRLDIEDQFDSIIIPSQFSSLSISETSTDSRWKYSDDNETQDYETQDYEIDKFENPSETKHLRPEQSNKEQNNDKAQINTHSYSEDNSLYYTSDLELTVSDLSNLVNDCSQIQSQATTKKSKTKKQKNQRQKT